MTYELHLRREGTTVAHRVRGEGDTIGRDPGNDLVVNDPLVSQTHARIWVDDGTLWVRDLGSSNGTFADDVRLDDAKALPPGTELRVGDTRLVVRATGAEPASQSLSLVVEDVVTGVCIALASSRLTIGGDLDADLFVQGLPGRAATLIVHEWDEVWLGTGEGERELELGETFEVAGRRFALRPGSDLRAATLMPKDPAYAFSIRARLDGPTGAEATVTDLRLGRSHLVESENRAVLLYMLARQHARDEALGAAVADRDRGWCSNDEVMTGIWGRNQSRDNTLHVLVHRLRSELEQAGLDPWFIEKRRGYVRARLVQSEVD